jgi:hypothetical protein
MAQYPTWTDFYMAKIGSYYSLNVYKAPIRAWMVPDTIFRKIVVASATDTTWIWPTSVRTDSIFGHLYGDADSLGGNPWEAYLRSDVTDTVSSILQFDQTPIFPGMVDPGWNANKRIAIYDVGDYTLYSTTLAAFSATISPDSLGGKHWTSYLRSDARDTLSASLIFRGAGRLYGVSDSAGQAAVQVTLADDSAKGVYLTPGDQLPSAQASLLYLTGNLKAHPVGGYTDWTRYGEIGYGNNAIGYYGGDSTTFAYLDLTGTNAKGIYDELNYATTNSTTGIYHILDYTAGGRGICEKFYDQGSGGTHPLIILTGDGTADSTMIYRNFLKTDSVEIRNKLLAQFPLYCRTPDGNSIVELTLQDDTRFRVGYFGVTSGLYVGAETDGVNLSAFSNLLTIGGPTIISANNGNPLQIKDGTAQYISLLDGSDVRTGWFGNGFGDGNFGLAADEGNIDLWSNGAKRLVVTATGDSGITAVRDSIKTKHLTVIGSDTLTISHSGDTTHAHTTASNVHFDKNVYIDGNVTGSVYYGGMYIHSDAGVTIPFAAASTWYTFTGLTAGMLNGFTHADSVLTASYGSVYKVTYNATGQGQNNHIYHIAVARNDTILVNTEDHMTGQAGVLTKMAGGGHITAVAGSKIKLKIQDASGTGNGTLYNVNIHLERIGN